MAAAPSASAIRALALEYKSLTEDPVEGFRVKLLNEEDMFVWEVALFGPPDTLYQGGYFKVNIHQTRSFLPAVSYECHESTLRVHTHVGTRAQKLTSTAPNQRVTLDTDHSSNSRPAAAVVV